MFVVSIVPVGARFGSKRRCAMTMGDEETRGVLDIGDHALKRGMDSRARNRY